MCRHNILCWTVDGGGVGRSNTDGDERIPSGTNDNVSSGTYSSFRLIR